MEALLCIAMTSIAAFAAMLAACDAVRRKALLRDARDVAGARPALPKWIAGILIGAAADAHPLRGALIAGLAMAAMQLLGRRRRARERRSAIERRLPPLLDAITLAVEAGLDLAQAFSRATERERFGPLAEELRRLDAALKIGTPRREAMAEFASRLGVPAIRSLAILLRQAERLGTGVAPALRACALRLREERFARAELRGARAAQQLLLPLILCILPATFIVIFGPLAVRWIAAGPGGLL